MIRKLPSPVLSCPLLSSLLLFSPSFASLRSLFFFSLFSFTFSMQKEQSIMPDVSNCWVYNLLSNTSSLTDNDPSERKHFAIVISHDVLWSSRCMSLKVKGFLCLPVFIWEICAAKCTCIVSIGPCILGMICLYLASSKILLKPLESMWSSFAFLKVEGKVSFLWKQAFPCEKYVIFGSPHSILERRKTCSLSCFPVLFINFIYLAEEMFLKISSIWSISANLIVNIQLI